ncbi:MAG: PQQ-dependent sugar dehydrogenase [Candidatus Limnocylindria bacterium]
MPAVARPAAAGTFVEPTAPAILRAGQVDLQLVTAGLSSPVGVTNASDGTNRLFVVQQGGTVKIVSNHRLQSGTFLNLSGVSGGISTGGERGLLGLAFHPSFEANGKLYINYTNGGGHTVIAELTANAARTSASLVTRRVLLTVAQPFANHNGGQLAFGEDGYLYIGLGDGGSAGDPQNNAQNRNSLLGKLLRIDVNGTQSGLQYRIPAGNPYVGVDGRDEIWALGLRNPWRFSFDRVADRLWIADVGQGAREEINRASTTTPGINYGWRCREGRLAYTSCGSAGPFTDPVVEYGHGNGDCSVTGGHVYRGTSQPDLIGQYVLGDYCSGRIWTISAGAGSPSLVLQRDTGALITSFGESEVGELYMTDHAGRLYRVVAPPFTDIANSGFLDEIVWIADEGITGGCGGSRYCPAAPVTREQMASFLARAMNLPAATRDYFSDDNASPHEGDINRVARAGITGGCDTNRFCPSDNVTREQMASFLVRALALPGTSTNYFDDDGSSQHHNQINALARSGITGGCDTRRYCPTATVTRGQMAAFLERAFR